ncbi:hypothetical protein [Vreelandella hamiltonii]|uniref:Uncharacterized protein n=1 Tax=Vreelandella hamiltonii TaxID=502829 RepID=A0A8H9I2P0_9GAMM|nr:hypothetical protein [Halomonas hamiltonii]GGW23645.1 hypothetical protein GCM10007157_13710 [Halomonas hamiltonii]
MSAKQTTKAAPPPRPRVDVSVRVKTKSPGIKRQVCGVIITNEWKRLLLDDKGSAYKAIARDPALVMEQLPYEPLSDAEVAADKLPSKEKEAK